MSGALSGLLLGLAAGGLSVASLWLITGFASQAARGLSVPAEVERPSGWDAAAQDPDVVTAGQWLRIRQESVMGSEKVGSSQDRAGFIQNLSPTVPPPEARLRHATLRLFFTFLLKAPVLVLIALGARSLGNVVLHWCVGGVILVYCLAVFWAAARTRKG